MCHCFPKTKTQVGLFGRYFNTYFSDNMGNLTNPTNSEIRTLGVNLFSWNNRYMAVQRLFFTGCNSNKLEI